MDVRSRRRWIGIAALVAFVATGIVARAEREPVEVYFSFGKIEVLRADGTEWHFVRSGMRLGPDDLVRMPPVALLRLTRQDGTRLALVSGLHETTVEALIGEAIASEQRNPDGRGTWTPTDAPTADVLPLGDPTEKETTPAAPLILSDEEASRWKERVGAEETLVRAAAEQALRAAREDGSSERYPTERIRLLRRLYETMREAVAGRTPLASLFPEGDTQPLFLLTALLVAAEVPIEQELLDDGRPVLLVESDVPSNEAGRLTANRRLVRIEPGRNVLLPLHPVSRSVSFLDAWYAAEALRTE